MSGKLVITILIALFVGGYCFAQKDQSSEVNDFKPASSSQPDKQYPQVNSKGRIRVRIVALQAQSVLLDIGGRIYDLTKGEDGAWIRITQPQDEGFHYYQLIVNGALIPEPSSLFFYGAAGAVVLKSPSRIKRPETAHILLRIADKGSLLCRGISV